VSVVGMTLRTSDEQTVDQIAEQLRAWSYQES
jgi:hypothetical protein